MERKFDISLSDAQATPVMPVAVSDFDFGAFRDYEDGLLESCGKFWEEDRQGVLVYRRMRVAEVFSYGCRDMKASLEWQLGALQESMKFRGDVPNFLEPWYGLGTAASAFGFGYRWDPGQAPAVDGKFITTREALDHGFGPIADSSIGKQTLSMIEYFMEQTGGMLPMSYCDVQSPLNVAGNIVDTNNFMTDLYMDPEAVALLLNRIADLCIEFTGLQRDLIGDALASPGHGFASARNWTGFGQSDDNIVMLPEDVYTGLVLPSFGKCGAPFGGPVLHSCGNWASKIPAVKKVPGLRMVDAAFSYETDPDPNEPGAFADGFRDTGIVVNARIVGNVRTLEEKLLGLWKPGMKLVVVTYCKTPEEQSEAYDLIHSICK